jgi:hypothetical protein
MMPALGRGLQFVQIAMNSDKMPNVDIMFPLYITEVVILGMLLFAAWRFNTLRHPATYLAVAVNVFNLLIEPLGRSESVQMFLKAMIKG